MLRLITFLPLSLEYLPIKTACESGLSPHPNPLPSREREQQRYVACTGPLPPPRGRARERGRTSRPKSPVAIRYGIALAIVLLAQALGLADEPAFRIDPTVLEDLGARFDRKGLQPVADVLAAPDHPDYDWVRSVYQRLVGVGQGSGVVLYRTQRGADVLVTAAHVLPYEALVSAKAAQSGLRVLFVPPITWREYEREVPRNRDFAVALVEGGTPPVRGRGWRVTEAGLPGMASIQPGQEVLLMGAPAVGNLALMYSVGRVFSTAEARKHDPQHDADKQFVVQASAAGRMSGGGVFARDGSYLGVITTGYFTGHPKALVSDYVGGVRATWIEKRFLAYLADLPEAQRRALTELMR